MTVRGGDALRYDTVVDPEADDSHGKLVRLVGRDKRVLELGVGTGAMAKALKARGCTTVGVESDKQSAELAERYCEHVVVGDLDELDLEAVLDGRTFDIVLAGDVLEHLKDPARTLRQAAGLLSSGGLLAASVPNLTHGAVRLSMLNGSLPRSEKGLLDRTHLQFLDRDGILEMITAGGFTPLVVDDVRVGIGDTEIAIPGGALTDAVRSSVEALPDSTIYQFVVLAALTTPHGPEGLTETIAHLSSELDQTREHAARLQNRVDVQDLDIEGLTALGADVDRRIRESVDAQLTPLKLDMLAARDQAAAKDHELDLAQRRYDDKCAILRESEAERAHLHRQVREAQEELHHVVSSRWWQLGIKQTTLRGRLRRLAQR
jgi:ubiquinone/menaquinone biosynthesis C-methylase UbiE